ncbi:5'-methylthioadenosine/adenosylhomocysteine nucleosidase [Periweissella fabalis]|uniref:5'-methylthioadenosine/S-adenosylhomocysteine nucleosidase n=1 Tax=Periweissella fabalis TaxID=1070421 RepID=A0A7X6N477_9LACO|nr:5'-methylthioadenosine/adenosylhomocysteine nucleosidase [Periweissella fabalis]MCM0599324.1 5'-methylthioadenosine/adenosylhomocysteine nucleosidase [Periweissella fabalis]NKZ23603.1 5'-methylthioadenosine/adenosylhomocysteine nucleosidase [Periweissella fabalis]
MKYGIINAMPEEMANLEAAMENLEIKSIKHIDFHVGTIAGQDVVVVESGIGKVQAGLTTALLITNFDVDVIINSGSAGAIGEGLKIGDVVVASETAYHDVDATVFGYSYGQVPQQPARFVADKNLVTQIMDAAKSTGLHTVTGLIVTSDSFVASAQQVDRIKANFPDAMSAEMESAAIAQAAHQFGIPYAVIRAMSDNADGDAGVTFDEFIVQAGKQSADMLIALFKNQAAK